ncbi:unnamed protein product [Tetraodon nigroviridis]|uniref:(spotted green pufferfish) hypothetical protein n=1 Tax=Tetraodon nigroviridis TaxID=99883 RepID=Q4S1V3_TETNG|nr:unnamed protein product [Tetraodon nigroviridis]
MWTEVIRDLCCHTSQSSDICRRHSTPRWTPTLEQRRSAAPQTSGDPTRARPADGSSPALKAFALSSGRASHQIIYQHRGSV